MRNCGQRVETEDREGDEVHSCCAMEVTVPVFHIGTAN